MEHDRSNLTQLLADATGGDDEARDHVMSAAYEELRRIATAQLRRASRGTLQTTALVHETYLRLFDREPLGFNDRVHFFALSARAMRQILIEHFRRETAGKRGGGTVVVNLDDREIPVDDRAEVILALDQALSRLAELDERLAKVVEYRFFGGMTEAEIGKALGVTDRTVRSLWTKAKAWLRVELADGAD